MDGAFGDLLKSKRTQRALTQELLAERAGISVGAVAALESGRRRSPRLSTVTLLADALELDEAQRAELAEAALGGAAKPAAGPQGERHETHTGTSKRAPSSAERPDGIAYLAPTGGWRHPFVGRSAEMDGLLHAAHNHRRLVMVSGEAGIGKTRLVDHFAEVLRSRGSRVFCGRWTEERLWSYEGFIPPLRQAASVTDIASLTGCGELVRIIPEMAARLPPSTNPTKADAEVERRLLFEAVATLIGSLGPALMVLDDLHWADPSSLALLKFLSTSPDLSSLLIVATMRPVDRNPEVAGFLADLSRRSDLEHLRLGTLDPDELSQLVVTVCDGQVSTEWAREVAVASEGNTFFAQELAELRMSREGTSVEPIQMGGLGVPERILDTIASRVSSLSKDAQMLLGAGSVLWRQFDPGLASRMAGLADGQVVAAVEDALLSGLVHESGGVELVFSHGLVQAALYSSMSSIRRVDLHWRAALALENDGDTKDPSAVAQIARHWAEVASHDRSATDAAARWTVLAGDMALSAAATDEAIAHYQKARDWLSKSTAGHADALIKLGSALSASGRDEEADQHYRSALALARGLNDVALQVRAAMGLSQTLVLGDIDQERVSALEDVLVQLDPGADEYILVLASLLRQLIFDRRPSTTARRDAIAVEVFEAVDQPALPDALLIGLGSMREFIPITEPEPLDRLTRQIIAAAERRSELHVLANGWWGQAWSALERADPGDWSAAVRAYEETATVLRTPAVLSVAASMSSVAAQIEGRFDQAKQLSDVALEHGRAAHDPNAEPLHIGRSICLGWETGAAAELLPLMVDLAAAFKEVSTFQAGLALTAALAGDVDLAQRVLKEGGRQRFQDIRQDVEWIGTVVLYSNASVIVGEREHCEHLHRLLVKSPITAVRLGPITNWWGPVDHHLGALCRVLGLWEEARTRLERARAIEMALGAEPFLRRTQTELDSLPAPT